MKKILTAASVFAVLFPAAGTAQEGNPLLTRPGWELGGQAAHYWYEEPDFAKLSGNRVGIVVARTFTDASGFFSRIDLRGSYGRLKYESAVSGTQDGVPDWILEARAVAGWDWVGGSVSLSPYLGLGYRYLYDDSRGYSTTGAIGYRRYSNYLYAPVGLTARYHLGDGWVLTPTLEADVFLQGTQVSKLSDTDLGYIDVTNDQKKGRGHRASLMLEKDRWALGAWWHYWHIEDSDIQFAGVVNGVPRAALEPANYTRESGLESRYQF